MRTIIAGSRTFADYQQLSEAMARLPWKPTEIISGMAQGADRLGERWAAKYNVPVKQYPADWATYGRRAGHIRNSQMALVGEALVAFWDGESQGTADMIAQMNAAGKQVVVVEFKPVVFEPLLPRKMPPLERK